ALELGFNPSQCRFGYQRKEVLELIARGRVETKDRIVKDPKLLVANQGVHQLILELPKGLPAQLEIPFQSPDPRFGVGADTSALEADSWGVPIDCRLAFGDPRGEASILRMIQAGSEAPEVNHTFNERRRFVRDVCGTASSCTALEP